MSIEIEGKKTDMKNMRVLIFRLSPRVDFNKDSSVSAKEMQRWIMEKTEEHFQEAMKENKNGFHAVDPDGDGKSAFRNETGLSLDFGVEKQALDTVGWEKKHCNFKMKRVKTFLIFF